jgi:hypothetical protein
MGAIGDRTTEYHQSSCVIISFVIIHRYSAFLFTPSSPRERTCCAKTLIPSNPGPPTMTTSGERKPPDEALASGNAFLAIDSAQVDLPRDMTR